MLGVGLLHIAFALAAETNTLSGESMMRRGPGVGPSRPEMGVAVAVVVLVLVRDEKPKNEDEDGGNGEGEEEKEEERRVC